tara:strand:- start:697 stop:855 length:159 start_codon:yes stop_codon:yes gene_type:complete
MKNEKDIKNNKVSKSKLWVKPSIENIGNAKDIVANVNVTGLGDSQFSVLNPS